MKPRQIPVAPRIRGTTISKENTVKIRRKTFLAASAATIGATALAACGGNNSNSGSSNASDGGKDGAAEAPERADADLVIWTDEKKANSLKDAAKKWGEANGMSVAVQIVATDPQANFITANQAGNGPDMILAAHDWIGNLIQNSAITPVQLSAKATESIDEIGMKAATYEGQVYGLPYAVETLVLYSNNALTDVPEPKTIEELVEAGKASGAEDILSLPIGEEGDAYHMEPLYTSGGGYLFGRTAEGDPDPSDIGVGKEGSIAAGEKLKELGAEGVLKTSITGENSIARFTDGKAAYLISGPWALADIQKAGMDYTMSAIPGFEGMNPAEPFAGVNLFFVAASGKNAVNAQTFLQSIAEDSTVIEEMFPINPLPPVNKEIQKKLAGEHPDMIKNAELASKALPMPAIPAMAAVWQPLGIAQANIVKGADPKDAMESAGEQIKSQI